jgi:hypothetical protein
MEWKYFSMTQIIDIKKRSMNGFTFVGDLVLRPVILGIYIKWRNSVRGYFFSVSRPG